MADKRKHSKEPSTTSQEKKVLKHSYGKKFWGPYLSERQWCTVREEVLGNCWEKTSYTDIAPGSYKWGEDGIFGLSDEEQKLCIGLTMWNGKDPVKKERFFGLTGPQGNHGEDVKELYYYLDNHPDHKYMRAVYLYPQTEFPYEELTTKNKNRTAQEPEYEILDTGVFDDGYWHIDVEFAKPENSAIICKYTITNRGPHTCTMEFTPRFWFRKYYNTKNKKEIPYFEKLSNEEKVLMAYDLGKFQIKFCNSMLGVCPETEIVHDSGKKSESFCCSSKYRITVEPGEHDVISWELYPNDGREAGFDFGIIENLKQENDRFYDNLYGPSWSAEEKLIAKGAWVGLLWNKQFYYYDIEMWYKNGHAREVLTHCKHEETGNWNVSDRNHKWKKHFKAHDILSIPDKWEFPWFAAWDTCFQMIPFCRLDPEFAKKQLLLLLSDRYMSPDGQIPGCEFNFDDNNPPIHAWACLKVFRMIGGTDFSFLKSVYEKLQQHYHWWIINLQCSDSYTFNGGFLGLDNISVIDRGQPPEGYLLKQVDATAWMALFALSMLETAIELKNDKRHTKGLNLQENIDKYLTDFIQISQQLNKDIQDGGFWNPKMNFYNDVLVQESTKQYIPIEVKSLVGLLPLVACCKIESRDVPSARQIKDTRFTHVIENKEDTLLSCIPLERISDILQTMFNEEEFLSPYGLRSLSKVHSKAYTLKLQVESKVLKHGHHGYEPSSEEFSKMESEENIDLTGQSSGSNTKRSPRPQTSKKSTSKSKKFLMEEVAEKTSLKSVTKGDKSVTKEETMTYKEYSLHYAPGESDCGIYGGNSNWRGPIWICANYILLEALEKIHSVIGDTFKIAIPGGGSPVTLDTAIKDACRTLVSIFLPSDSTGERPLHGGYKQYMEDSWKDLILYYEYFHADTGRGCGASHQTGWTALITEILFLLHS